MRERPRSRLMIEEGAAAGLDREQEQLLAYWDRLAAAADPPAWKRFDPLEVWPLVPCLALHEILDEGEDLLFRLAGGALEERVGRSLRGKRLGELYPRDRLASVRATLREMLAEPRPRLRAGALVLADRGHHRYRRLSLPFAEEDGGPVAFILAHYSFER